MREACDKHFDFLRRKLIARKAILMIRHFDGFFIFWTVEVVESLLTELLLMLMNLMVLFTFLHLLLAADDLLSSVCMLSPTDDAEESEQSFHGNFIHRFWSQNTKCHLKGNVTSRKFYVILLRLHLFQ